MKTKFQLAIILALLNACRQPVSSNSIAYNTTNFYSKTVHDSFSIFISLPDDYDEKKATNYPLVYLLDANLYFDTIATAIKKYNEIGMLPPVILVGIGYKNLAMMDSLRTRDYTYPLAIPEYEMSTSGQADKFLTFLKRELTPTIENQYAIDKTNLILMGHSLGGYFTMYALQQSLLDGENVFNGFIAASPSLHYNHNYLLKEFEKSRINSPNNTRLYVTFGGLEDIEEDDNDTTQLKTNEIFASLATSFKNKINYQSDSYSNLGHMDTQLPTFIKGLQWIFHREK